MNKLTAKPDDVENESWPASGDKNARGGQRRLLPPSIQAGLLLLLAVCGIVFAWKSSTPGVGKDFYQFWVIGQTSSRPGINVYASKTLDQLGAEFLQKAEQSANPRLITVAQYRQTLQAYSSPFLYALFRSFSTGNYEVDFRNYRLLLLGSFVLGTLVFCRLLKYSWTMAAGVIAIFSIWYDPLTSDLLVGNVDCLQLAALAVYLWTVTRMRWRHRDFAGGALLGIAVAFKPNLVFVAGALAIFWILSGRIRRLWFHAAGAVAGGIGAVLFSTTSFHGLRCWSEWVSALRSLPADVIPVNNGNSSPMEILCESFTANAAVPFAVVVIGLSIAMLWDRRRMVPAKASSAGGNTLPDVFAVSLGSLLVVIAARLAWFHYYVLVIPAFLFLLQPAGAPASGARSVVSRLLPVFAFLCLTPFSLVGNALFANPEAVLAAGAALLLFLALALFPAAPKPAAATAKC